MNAIVTTRVPDAPILGVDVSYTIFHQYHATVFWYKVSHKQETIEPGRDWTQFPEFMDKYTQLYKKKLETILSSYTIPVTNVVFAKDSPSRSQLWRTQEYPEYKQQRDKIYQDPNWKIDKFFTYTYEVLLPTLCHEWKCSCLQFPPVEADDILGVLHRSVRVHEPHVPIYIITSDHDYLQLIDDQTTFLTWKNKCWNHKSIGTARDNLLYKIIRGDPSDNIPSCFPRCGQKTAMKLLQNPQLLESYFKKYPESTTIFKRNEQLIDMTKVPESFLTIIQQTLKPIIKPIIKPIVETYCRNEL